MIKRLVTIAAHAGGILALAFFIAVVVSLTTKADLVNLNTYTTGLSYGALTSQLSADMTELEDKINGKLNYVNFDPTPIPADKLRYEQLNFQVCDPNGTSGCITDLDLSPTTQFITASTTTGIISRFGPLRAHAQASPDLTLDVEAGTYRMNGKMVVYAGGNSPAIQRPASDAWIAVLALDEDGNFDNGLGASDWIYGHATVSPAIPRIPVGLLPIAMVFARSSATCSVILDADDGTNCYVYRDARPIYEYHNGHGANLLYQNHFYNVLNDTGPEVNCVTSAGAMVFHSSSTRSHTLRFSTSVAADVACGFEVGANTSSQPPVINTLVPAVHRAVMRVKTDAEPGTNYQIGVFAPCTNSDPNVVNGVYIVKHDATNAKLKVKDGGSATTSGTTWPFTVESWNTIEFEIDTFNNGTPTAKVYVNGVLRDTLTDANVPAADGCSGAACTLGPCFFLDSSGAVETGEFDFIELSVDDVAWKS